MIGASRQVVQAGLAWAVTHPFSTNELRVRDPRVPSGPGWDQLSVAVDVQVHRATEYFGMATTCGLSLTPQVRSAIHEAWQRRVTEEGIDDSPRVVGIAAALDPTLWYSGRWGRTWCEEAGHRVPVATFCGTHRQMGRPA